MSRDKGQTSPSRCFGECEREQFLQRISTLEARIHEAKEIYTGMEGFIAETAPEAYQQRVLNQMWAALTAGYLGEGNEL